MTQDCPHEELKEIFRQALRAESEEERLRLRRKGIRIMLAAPESCFWPLSAKKSKASLDQERYIKAWDIAWEYIERKIYGDVRGKGTAEDKAYDPDKGNRSPIDIWNFKCEKEYNNLPKNPKHMTPPNPIDSRTGEPLNVDDISVNDLADPTNETPRLELVRQEFETDPSGELKSSFVRKKPPPPITAQAVLLEIYDRTSRGEEWTLKILAEHFGINTNTMNSAWWRTLKPLLRKIGDRLRDEMKNEI